MGHSGRTPQQNKPKLQVSKQNSQTHLNEKSSPIPNLNLDQTYDQGNTSSWNFLLPETKDFIMKCSGHTPREEEEALYDEEPEE